MSIVITGGHWTIMPVLSGVLTMAHSHNGYYVKSIVTNIIVYFVVTTRFVFRDQLNGLLLTMGLL